MIKYDAKIISSPSSASHLQELLSWSFCWIMISFWYQIAPISDREVSKYNYGCAATAFWHVATHSARRSICSPPSCKRAINNTSAISKAWQQLELTHGQPPYNRRAAPRHCRDINGDDVCCRHGGWNRRLVLISHPWREGTPSHGAIVAQQAQRLELSSQWLNYSLKQTQWF